jgi:nucleoside 2-deoxyribosyltransferase
VKIAYVAGPYRGKSKIWIINKLQVVRNIIRARKVAKELWKKGYAAICPHSNTALFDGIAPDKAFLNGDIEILKRCDLVVLVGDWLKSSGTRNEVTMAYDYNIPVYIWDYTDNDFISVKQEL